MPRRARSTLRAEIKEGGPLGASSMDFSDSVSVVGVSDDTSPELLMLSLLLCFAEKLMVEFENKEAFLGVEA